MKKLLKGLVIVLMLCLFVSTVSLTTTYVALKTDTGTFINLYDMSDTVHIFTEYSSFWDCLRGKNHINAYKVRIDPTTKDYVKDDLAQVKCNLYGIYKN